MLHPVLRFQGKTALITGASSGIGRALAVELDRRGASLVLTGRNRAALDQLTAACPGSIALEADLADGLSLNRFCDAVLQRSQGIDFLIHNAGVGMLASCWDTAPDLARRLLTVNFLAPVELTRQLAPRISNGGAVAFVSSLAGIVALPGMSVYSASKHALNAYADVLRIELRPRHIHVLTACPGIVATPFSENMLQGPAESWLTEHASKGISPERCAASILAGIARRKRTVVVPKGGWALVAAKRLSPRVFEFMMGRIEKGIKSL